MPRNLNNITQTNGYTVIKPNIPLEWSSMYMAKTNQGTGDCGKIIPVYIKELMPNQTINLEQSVALQFTPFVSNLFHQIRGELMTFFVPYRICAFMRTAETIDEDTEEEADQLKWQAYITGGKSGNDTQKLQHITYKDIIYSYSNADANGETLTGTLLDYFGMPILPLNTSTVGMDASINMLAHNAYNLIYNNKFRNPDYTAFKPTMANLTDGSTSTNATARKLVRDINRVATAYWNADRFTRARKVQYRGIAPTIPIGNDLIELATKLSVIEPEEQLNAQKYKLTTLASAHAAVTPYLYATSDGKLEIGERGTENADGSADGESNHTFGDKRIIAAQTDIPEDTIEGRIDYNEFLYNLALLKYETNNARIKPLYIEHLKYRFGIFPQDSRFQEPEWLSSNSFNIGIDINQATAGTTQISESGETINYTQNDQGKITSQAWGSGRNLRTEYKALEHGIIITLMIIRPEGVYEGGLQRHWWGDRKRFDFPTPEMMNLPDQMIWKGELKFTGNIETDKGLFGWEQIYDENRTETNQVCGLLRPSLDQGLKSYTLARYFENAPEMNDNFLLCKPEMSRIKQYTNQPDFIFFVRSELKTALPMPIINEPVNIGM